MTINRFEAGEADRARPEKQDPLSLLGYQPGASPDQPQPVPIVIPHSVELRDPTDLSRARDVPEIQERITRILDVINSAGVKVIMRQGQEKLNRNPRP